MKKIKQRHKKSSVNFDIKKGKAGTTVLAFLLFLSWSILLGSTFSPSKGNHPRLQPRSLPFDGKESFLYQARWSGIPIAQASIDMHPLRQENKEFYQVIIRARTLRYLDPLWKMRDSMESIFEADSLRPHRFIFRQRENSKKIKTSALYKPENKHWIVQLNKKRQLKQYEVASENTLDPITASYLVRRLEWQVGDQLQLNVFVGGKKCYPLSLKIVGKESISIKAGVFDTYKIVSRLTRLTRSGKLKEVREAFVWISADERKILLKASGDAFIGRITIELVNSSVNLKTS